MRHVTFLSSLIGLYIPTRFTFVRILYAILFKEINVFWAIWLIIWPFSKSKVTKAQFFCLGFTFFEFSLRVHLSKLRLANITKNLYLVIFWIRISRVYSSRSLCKDSYLKETKYVGDSILSDEKTGKFLNCFEIFREFA